MKKNCYLIALVAIIFSCTTNNQTSPTAEKKIIKIEADQYYNGILEGKDVFVILDGKKLDSYTYYDTNQQVVSTIDWKYNANGLCTAEEHYDANTNTPSNDSSYAEYDSQNRIIKVTQWDRVIDFTYNSDTTITATTTLSAPSSLVWTSTYYTNSEGNIYKYLNPGTRAAELFFEGNQAKQFVVTYSFSPLVEETTNYTYQSSFESLPFSFGKLRANTSGSINNGILFSDGFEYLGPSFYSEDYISKEENITTNRIETYTYSTNSENDILTIESYSNGILSNRIKVFYE